ncbi:MAG: hypothetical protein H7245_12585 [Candidatus Saccharibacteria bacterium]|nr:hypothetical protein [Pseudorhodobacter sp.]
MAPFAAILPTDRDDILDSQHNSAVIHGLSGNDAITGHHVRLNLFGDAGSDMITASGGVIGQFYGSDGNAPTLAAITPIA